MQLQRQRGPDHLLLEQRRNVALLHPALPVAGRFVPESLAQRRREALPPAPPSQHQMLPSGERKRLAAQVGKRNVGSEPQLAGESFKTDVMRALHDRGPFLGPAQPRLADHGNTRCTFDRLDDSDQLRRPERAAELQEARREINHAKRACRGSERSFRECWYWAGSAECRSRHPPVQCESARHPALSRSVEHTGSESNRGRQHQTISPLLCTSAENWQFPINPRSSSRMSGTLPRDEHALMKGMPRMARFILALIVGLALLMWAASGVVQTTAREWFERDVSSRAQLVLIGARQSLADAWYDPKDLEKQLVALARDERVMGAAACDADFSPRSSTPGFPDEFSCLAVGPRVRSADAGRGRCGPAIPRVEHCRDAAHRPRSCECDADLDPGTRAGIRDPGA